MGVVTLKPNQKRRLGAECAIYRRFNNFSKCADACNLYAKRNDIDATFNRVSIQQYVGCQANLSVKRLKILAAVLNVKNMHELDEVFIAPKHRGEGDYWRGDQGNKVKDIDMSMLDFDIMR